MQLHEVGKVYSKRNFSEILKAFKALRTALGAALADEAIADAEQDEEEDPPTKKKPIKEASSWALADIAQALGRELNEKTPNAYILDIFPEENKLVYQIGWRGAYYECGYTLDDTGVALFTDPVEVSRKISYIPTSDQSVGPTVPVYADESAAPIDVEIMGDQVDLIERAVGSDGTVMLKLISEGLGSSGYYSADVLKRDGPKVFTKGLHNLIDHPTASEEAQRPEGSLDRLGSTLIEDARWLDNYRDKSGTDHGAGLYAKALVKESFRSDLDTIAPHIGVSIRATGKARIGTINGKQIPIIETIERAKSVDYVTSAGRGGKVIDLLESARQAPTEDHTMGVSEEEFKQLQESNRALADRVHALQLAAVRVDANATIDRALEAYPTLPSAIKLRIAEAARTRSLPVNDAGELDSAALTEAVRTLVAEETAYLARLGAGHIRGLGGISIAESTRANAETLDKEIDTMLNAL